MSYVLITQTFAEQTRGVFVDPNQFNYAVTTDGRYVCDANSMLEFPDQFAALEQTGWSPTIIELAATDFPVSDFVPPFLQG